MYTILLLHTNLIIHYTLNVQLTKAFRFLYEKREKANKHCDYSKNKKSCSL